MKKILILVVTSFAFMFASAQTEVVKVKSGTLIPLQSLNEVKAADVNVGDLIDFRVATDIKVNGAIVVPQGTITKGTVTEACRSTVAGTKGRLSIEITSVPLENGEKLYLTPTYARAFGQNRTTLAVALGIFCLPCILIPGTKAVMPAGYEVQGFVSNNTEVEISK